MAQVAEEALAKLYPQDIILMGRVLWRSGSLKK